MAQSTVVGLLTSTYSVFSFSGQYVWLRKHETADGLFTYWLQCIAIYLVGVLVDLACGLPKFQPIAMLGRCFWAIGNTASVPLINTLGLGDLLWTSVNTLVGWVIERFGIPGVVGAAAINSWLNYAGVVVPRSWAIRVCCPWAFLLDTRYIFIALYPISLFMVCYRPRGGYGAARCWSSGPRRHSTDSEYRCYSIYLRAPNKLAGYAHAALFRPRGGQAVEQRLQ